MILQNLHTHSTYCDGKNTISEMVDTAVKKGFSSIGFSSHSYMSFDASLGLSPDDEDSYFEDIRQLLAVLGKLADKGNTVVVIEHNLDVVKVADHIIDIGPDGGQAGGRVVAEGTVMEIATNPNSVTGKFLKEKL